MKDGRFYRSSDECFTPNYFLLIYSHNLPSSFSSLDELIVFFRYFEDRETRTRIIFYFLINGKSVYLNFSTIDFDKSQFFFKIKDIWYILNTLVSNFKSLFILYYFLLVILQSVLNINQTFYILGKI